jgi:hypothetical protein
VSRGPSITGPPPAQYTGCHAHDEDQYCLAPDGEEVLVLAAESEDDHAGHDHEDEHDEHDHDDDGHDHGEEGKMDCHFHAGVEYVFHSHSTSTDVLIDPDIAFPLVKASQQQQKLPVAKPSIVTMTSHCAWAPSSRC